MVNKKLFGIILFICCALFLIWRITLSMTQRKAIASGETAQLINTNPVHVVLKIDTGDHIATYDGIPASNAFDALATVTRTHAISLITKKYDFGIFVERIGNLTNSKNNVWIYYVNGASGDVAADKKSVKNGDVVGWKYTKPLY